MVTKTLATLLAAAASLAIAAQASAKILRVAPGPGTPLQDAIDAAAPGDTLRLAFGTYPEAIVVTKRLRILGASATIDAQCGAATPVTVAADDVRLERLRIVGGTLSQIDVQGRDRVILRNLRTAPTCDGVEYGLDALGATRLTVVSCSFLSYRDDLEQPSCPDPGARTFVVGMRIAATPAGGRVRVAKTFVCQSGLGVLVEGAASAPRSRPAVKIERNVLYANGRGILLQDVDGSVVRANEVQGDGGGTLGIEVDADSDDNVLRQNKVAGYPTDVSDAGASNCWRGTKHLTGSIPDTGCP